MYENKVENSAMMSLCFQTMQSFYSWAPLDEILQPLHVTVLVKYIEMSNDMSLYAFNCIIEIMGRKFIPKQSQQMLLQIFNAIFSIIQTITDSADLMQNMSSEYVNMGNFLY